MLLIKATKIMKLLGALLLIVGGIAHLLPPFYIWLSSLTGDSPYIQIIIGLLSVIVGIWMLVKKEG